DQREPVSCKNRKGKGCRGKRPRRLSRTLPPSLNFASKFNVSVSKLLNFRVKTLNFALKTLKNGLFFNVFGLFFNEIRAFSLKNGSKFNVFERLFNGISGG